MATPDGLVKTPQPMRWTLAAEKLGVGDAGCWSCGCPAGRWSNPVSKRCPASLHRPGPTGPGCGWDSIRRCGLPISSPCFRCSNARSSPGPSALGIYTVALDAEGRPEAALDHALTVLRAHRQVLLAEPLQPSE